MSIWKQEETAGYRHENKYLFSTRQMEALALRLRQVLRMDEHTDGDGVYHISSLYFDDYENAALHQTQTGVPQRDKFRIRMYNGNKEDMHLEKKSRRGGMTLKASCPISQEDCRAILRGELLDLSPDRPAVWRQFAGLQRSRLLRPACVVDYDRVAFVYEPGNVRVTLDCNVSAGTWTEDFLEGMPMMPVLEQDRHILEVKYDALLPSVVDGLLLSGAMLPSSFSKYALSREATGR